ncbi:MAG: DUF4845 domain-containing protein [Proteobacteria bacterium]|nr:DUF4845 domain-containing protein [Pseudomonadota bacterium]MBS0461941.1 DUF4845 domain-containing protein [Pseudomonadota bacterium]
MQLQQAQRGITLMGFVIMLIVVGFFAYMVMRIVPMYSEYSSISKALDAVAKDPSANNADEVKIRDMISRHFETSYVNSVDPLVKTYPGGVVIQHTPNGLALSVNYDARVPFIYNIFLVGHFEHTAGAQPAAGKPLPGGA